MGRVMIERPAPGASRDADIRTYPVKAGESVVAGNVVDVVGGVVTAGRAPVGSLAVGSIIKLNVSGVPTEFIVVHHGKPSSIYSSTFVGNTILLMKDCYESRQWHTSNVNDYANSAIHAYLNSTFLNLLDADVKSKVVQVKIPYRPGSGYGTTVSSGENGLPAKVWLLSGYELGWTNSNNASLPSDGAKLDFFLSGTSQSANDLRIAKLKGTVSDFSLRSPFCSSSYGATNVHIVNPDGRLVTDGISCTSSRGIRPVLVLPDTANVFTDASIIPSQAIALQPGAGGQSIDVIFDGTVELPGITAGTVIASPGVQGYSPQDGWLWVKPFWEQQTGTQIATGTYLGTGTYGANNPNILTFNFKPKLVFITENTMVYGSWLWAFGNPKGRIYLSSESTLYFNNLVWEEKQLTWYSPTDAGYQLNVKACMYYYVVIG